MWKDPVTEVSITHSQNKHEAGIQKVRGNMVSLSRGREMSKDVKNMVFP